MNDEQSRLIRPKHAQLRAGKISRRIFVVGATFITAAAEMMALGFGRASANQKADKADLSYQDSPNGDQNCAGCRFFDGDNACQIVAGDISADGWCTAWVEK